jgi:OOP family OmpA-OmpF porin
MSARKENPMNRLILAALLSCLVPAVVGGCQQQTPAPATPPGALPQPPPEPTREIHLTLGSYLQQCPNVLIRFPFDESQPLPQDTPELQALAACLNSGPYRTVRLRLIGRTDREGSEAHNLKLGQARAEYVKNALVRDGVDANRIETESAGAGGAGEGEGAPGYDRRVDVVQLVAINPI